MKDTFETITHLSTELLDRGHDGAVDMFNGLLDEIRYTLVNPGGRRAATLIRAIARWDALNEPLQVERVGG